MFYTNNSLVDLICCTNFFFMLACNLFCLLLLFFSPQASDDTHIMFINTIHNNDSEVITRNYINITFVCRYPINYMVQQPNGENMIRVDVRLPFYFNKVAVIYLME